jgi:hypothetical protein
VIIYERGDRAEPHVVITSWAANRTRLRVRTSHKVCEPPAGFPFVVRAAYGMVVDEVSEDPVAAKPLLPCVAVAPPTFEAAFSLSACATSAAGLLMRTAGADGGGSDARSRWSFYDTRRAAGRASGRKNIYRGLSHWREHQITGSVTRDMAARTGGPFQEVPLRSSAAGCCGDELLHDSILQLPSLVTLAECATLIAAADHFCAADGEWSDVALRRIECHPDGVNLDGESHSLAHIILARALWCIECLRPELAGALFPEAYDLGDLWIQFSGEEPALNRYTRGGDFDAHQDGHALTVLVPLSTSDVGFGGGGTAFWSEATIGTDPSAACGVPPSLVMKPPAGTGLFWRGHLTHAGLPVTSGTRHVFVASFNLLVPGAKG